MTKTELEQSFKGKHFLALEDFTPEQIRYLIDLAEELKAERKAHKSQKVLEGRDLLLLFEMKSTRTRCAFETSGCDLGLGTTFLSNSHFGATETVKDSMRVFSGMYDCIGYRGAKHSTLKQMAAYSDIPIINGYTDHQHPTQMLADLMTLDEVWGREGYLGKTLCFIGRGGAVNSFSYGVLCAIMGMNFVYITSDMELDDAVAGLSPAEQETFYKFSPKGVVSPNWNTTMDPVKRKIVEDLYAKYHPECTFLETTDVNAIKGVDVVTTENWGFFTDPVETWLPGIVRFRPYQVNRELMERTENPNAIVIHMLPSTHNMDHSSGQRLLSVIEDPELREFLKGGMEVTDEIFEENARYIFREAENRMHTIKAVIKAVTQ